MRELKERSTQDLLAERRHNVLELMRETDAMAIAMIQAHIVMIDSELRRKLRKP